MQQQQIPSGVQLIYRSPWFKNYVMYCVCIFILGLYSTSLGPLIPYLKEHSGKEEKQYSTFMMIRSICYILGSLSVKILENFMTYHHGIILGYIIAGVCFIAFDFYENFYVKAVLYGCAFIGASLFEIFSQITVIQCFKGGAIETAFLIQHSFAAIAGFFVPLVIVNLQLHSFTFLGLIALLVALPFLKLHSPEVEGGIHEQVAIQQRHQKAQVEEEQQILLNPLPAIVFVLFWCLYFFESAIEAPFFTWISTYATKRNFNTKEKATIYISIFSFSLTFARIIFAMKPGNAFFKTTLFSILGLFSVIASIIIIFKWNPLIGLVTISISLGLFSAPLYSLFQALPNESGFEITPKQFSSIAIAIGISEGVCTTAIGEVMSSISPEALFYSLGLMFLLILLLACMSRRLLRSEKQMMEQIEGEEMDQRVVDK